MSKKTVSQLEGMEKASVNLLTNSMQVDYDETKVSSQDIVDAVVSAGYGAHLPINKPKMLFLHRPAVLQQ